MKVSPKIILFFFSVLVIYLVSCKPDKQTRDASVDSLAVTLEVLHDSLNHAWQVMINDDDEKIQYMKRLLQEVSYSGVYDKKQYDQLMTLTEDLKKMRYDRQSMRQSSKIDEYDSATNEVIRQVVNFVHESPAYETSDLMKRLVREINEKNQMVLIYRVHYDAFAETINEILESSGEKIDTADRKWKIWPLFKLSPEEV